MKHVDASPSNNLSGIGWQILGELKLPAGPDTERAIHAWLTETSNPLNLDADFLNRILKSAHDAAVRAMDSNSATKQFRHIHLLIFAPRGHELKGKTWGFFRIEKLESATEDRNPPDHSIEFYLYIEG